MSRRFRVESQDPGSRLLGRMLPQVAAGDELVLAGRFGSFVVPAGVTVLAEGAVVERAHLGDAVVTGGRWRRLVVEGQTRLVGATVGHLLQSAGQIQLEGCTVDEARFEGELRAVGSRGGTWEIVGTAEVHAEVDVVVSGALSGGRLVGRLSNSGRVQLDRLDGRLHVTAGQVEIAEVDLSGEDPVVHVAGGAVDLDAGRIVGGIEHLGGTLQIASAVRRA